MEVQLYCFPKLPFPCPAFFPAEAVWYDNRLREPFILHRVEQLPPVYDWVTVAQYLPRCRNPKVYRIKVCLFIVFDCEHECPVTKPDVERIRHLVHIYGYIFHCICFPYVFHPLHLTPS